MGIENELPNNSPHPQIEKDPFVDEQGKEVPFSEEGILNRNFGKDPEKPSHALFYNNGILNRPLFHEKFEKIYKKAMGGENTSTQSPAEYSQRLSPESAVLEHKQEESPEDEEMRSFFEVFKNESDPEASAFEYIKSHLDPKLTIEEQLDKLRKFREDCEKHKRAIEASFK